MKTTKNFLSLLIILTSLIFVSCENEGVDPTLVPSTAGNGGAGGGGNTGGTTTVVGTYKMTAFNTSVATDLNNDGTASTNQLSETSCYNNSFLTLNSNNTFSADSKGVEIDFSNNTLECYTDPVITGTWTKNGSIVTISYNDGGTDYVETFTVSGNALIFTINDSEIVGTSAGEPIYLDSNIQIVYTKQ